MTITEANIDSLNDKIENKIETNLEKNTNEKEFKLSWDEFKLLIEYALYGIDMELHKFNLDLNYLEEHHEDYNSLLQKFEEIKTIKEKFNFDEELKNWNEEIKRKELEEKIKKDNIKKEIINRIKSRIK